MLYRRAFLLGGFGLAAGPQALLSQPISLEISLDPTRWQIGPIIRGKNYSPGMPAQPTTAGPGWSFSFPAEDGVHYVTTPLTGSVIGRRAVKARFAITGPGRLVPSQGDPPARARLFLQRRGDDWSGAGAFEFYRWWSVGHVELTEGEHELAATLAPNQWSSVFGKRGDQFGGAEQFTTAMADLQAVGLTFGGTFAGHGVFAVEGPARFTLMSYQTV
jgi:hypothetical protein